MRLPDENEEKGPGPSMISMTIGVCAFIVLILAVVLIVNRQSTGKGKESTQSGNEQTVLENEAGSDSGYASKDTDELISGSTLVSDDLDFWGMYPGDEDDKKTETESGSNKTDKNETQIENDPATDGKHTLIKYADGTEEWVLISQYLAKSTYDTSKFVLQSGIMKYYEDGTLTSFAGVDVSKSQGYVDFNKVVKDGIDFVMIRVGARGYSTGQLTLDEYFKDNIKGATDTSLHVGLYFSSQAKTKEEAVEEAKLVIDNLAEYDVDYPIVFEMDTITNDTSRTASLTWAERTDIAIAFMDTIKTSGYIPMVYGNKEWLITMVDLSKINNYDIWLAEEGDIPSYPYKFAMWQYSKTGSVDGISGYANMNISFIDFTEK